MKKRELLALGLIGVGLITGLIAVVWMGQPRQSPDPKAMAAANQLYLAGHYTQAVQAYEQIVAQGTADSGVLYNLGNAHMALGDVGRAVVNYRRAARLDPRDADIQTNLDYARVQAIDRLADAVDGPLDSLASLLTAWATPNEAAIAALGLWFLFGWLLVAWRRLASGKARQAAGIAALVVLSLVVLVGASLGSWVVEDRARPEAVVVAAAVAVSSEPSTESATQFSLHSGAEIDIVETRGGWLRLSLPGQEASGWLPLESVERI